MNTETNQNTKRGGSVAAGVMTVWIIVLLILLGGMGVVYVISEGKLGNIPDIEELQNPINKYATRVYSDDGVLMGTWSYASQNRVMVPYDSIPQNLVNALVATEDERFYDHSGIDFKAIGRAVVKRLIQGDVSRKDRKNYVDSIAASYILEDYIRKINFNGDK